MAERTPPSFLQNAGATHTAENTRLAVGSPILTSGIVNPADLAVTAPGGVMQVSVAAGQGWLVGSRTNQGAYHVINDAAKTVTIAASDASNPRYDRIVAEVKDSQYSGATNSFVISVIQGTPSSSPAEPAIPADSFELARVLVGAAVTSITSGAILDRRARAVRRGAVYSPATASDAALILRGLAGQTGAFLECRDSNSTLLASLDASGHVTTPNVKLTPIAGSGTGAALLQNRAASGTTSTGLVDVAQYGPGEAVLVMVHGTSSNGRQTSMVLVHNSGGAIVVGTAFGTAGSGVFTFGQTGTILTANSTGGVSANFRWTIIDNGAI